MMCRGLIDIKGVEVIRRRLAAQDVTHETWETITGEWRELVEVFEG
jgi:hypothetical protein